MQKAGRVGAEGKPKLKPRHLSGQPEGITEALLLDTTVLTDIHLKRI